MLAILYLPFSVANPVLAKGVAGSSRSSGERGLKISARHLEAPVTYQLGC